jgi:hypothetical protein
MHAPGFEAVWDSGLTGDPSYRSGAALLPTKNLTGEWPDVREPPIRG